MPRLHAIASLLLAISIPGKRNGVVFSSAFHTCNHRRAAASTARGRVVVLSTTQIATTEVKNDEATNDRYKTSSTVTLKFAGEAVFTSKLAPPTNDEKSLHEFFALPQSAPLLMRGSKNNHVHELENVDADLLEQYQESCDRVDALPPTSDDRIFEVTTSGVKFLPGLRVMNVATVGVKMTNQDLPGYELVFIQNLTYAEGNRLLVWFFNKVTGKDKDDNGDVPSDSGQTTFSLNRIRVVPMENGMISFESNTSLNIHVQFPAFLMKSIPGASIEKSEKIGSDSLRSVLEDDCPGSLEAFRQEYLRWRDSSIRL